MKFYLLSTGMRRATAVSSQVHESRRDRGGDFNEYRRGDSPLSKGCSHVISLGEAMKLPRNVSGIQAASNLEKICFKEVKQKGLHLTP